MFQFIDVQELMVAMNEIDACLRSDGVGPISQNVLRGLIEQRSQKIQEWETLREERDGDQVQEWIADAGLVWDKSRWVRPRACGRGHRSYFEAAVALLDGFTALNQWPPRVTKDSFALSSVVGGMSWKECETIDAQRAREFYNQSVVVFEMEDNGSGLHEIIQRLPYEYESLGRLKDQSEAFSALRFFLSFAVESRMGEIIDGILHEDLELNH